MTEWDATSYEGKDTILKVVRDEAEGALAERYLNLFFRI